MQLNKYCERFESQITFRRGSKLNTNSEFTLVMSHYHDNDENFNFQKWIILLCFNFKEFKKNPTFPFNFAFNKTTGKKLILLGRTWLWAVSCR